MIACIQIGGESGPILQGELLGEWTEPRRYGPAYHPETECRGAVVIDGQRHEGRLIKHSRGATAPPAVLAPNSPAVTPTAAGTL